MYSIGICGSLLKWFCSYLTGRSQHVVLEGSISSPLPVSTGVPQGSVLGPLLFNIFINPLCNVPLSDGCQIFLYADDILLTKPISSTHDLHLFQGDLNAIAQWLESHRLSPNIKKTHLLPITRSKATIKISVFLNGKPLHSCGSVKYLGVTITSDLSWATHISNLCKKANRQLGLLHREFGSAPSSVKDKIYRCSILPTLEYCSAVWSPHCKTHKQSLERVETFAARVVTRKWNLDRTTLLSSLHWPSLETRRKIQSLKVCYNIVNNLSIIPSSYFLYHQHPSPRHPHSQILYKPFAKTNSYMFSFFVNVVSMWNLLPSYAVVSSSPSVFKRHLSTLYH